VFFGPTFNAGNIGHYMIQGLNALFIIAGKIQKHLLKFAGHAEHHGQLL
jgi:hypothetical protein